MSDSPDFNAGGLIPGPYDGPRVWARGVCPLDGYHLIETEPFGVAVDGERVDLGGNWEHVIPPEEIPRMADAQARIAKAHGFEASAAAEQITRGGP